MRLHCCMIRNHRAGAGLVRVEEMGLATKLCSLAAKTKSTLNRTAQRVSTFAGSSRSSSAKVSSNRASMRRCAWRARVLRRGLRLQRRSNTNSWAWLAPSRKAGGATASEPDAEARDSRAPRSHFVSEVPKMRAKGGRRCVNGRIRGWGRPSGSSSQRARTGRRRKPSGEGGGNESSRGRAAESKGRSNIARQCETHATYVCARGAGRGAARGRRATRAQCVFGASEECSAVVSFNARVEKVR